MENGKAVVEKTATLMRPLVSPADLIRHHQEVTTLISEALVVEKDYGIIPGTKTPTLLKPGAERLAIAFGCAIEYEIVQSEIDHHTRVAWTKRKKIWNNKFQGDRTFREEDVSGDSSGIYRYVIKASLRNRMSGEVVGSGLGSCSTLEDKYVDRPRALENTVLKMAEKRALVAAALNTFGLSDRFTQDVEDMDFSPKSQPRPPAAKQQRQQPPPPKLDVPKFSAPPKTETVNPRTGEIKEQPGFTDALDKKKIQVQDKTSPSGPTLGDLREQSIEKGMAGMEFDDLAIECGIDPAKNLSPTPRKLDLLADAIERWEGPPARDPGEEG